MCVNSIKLLYVMPLFYCWSVKELSLVVIECWLYNRSLMHLSSWWNLEHLQTAVWSTRSVFFLSCFVISCIVTWDHTNTPLIIHPSVTVFSIYLMLNIKLCYRICPHTRTLHRLLATPGFHCLIFNCLLLHRVESASRTLSSTTPTPWQQRRSSQRHPQQRRISELLVGLLGHLQI